jgi:hypothetical protein
MPRALLVSAVALAGYAVAASAQRPAPASGGAIKPADIACTWHGKSMVGPKDSVIVTWRLTTTADGQGATVKMGDRDPIPVRMVAIGGDSTVTESGPFPSILRPGQTVATLRTIAHYKGNRMTGTFEAHYASGDVVRGKVQATCPK